MEKHVLIVEGEEGLEQHPQGGQDGGLWGGKLGDGGVAVHVIGLGIGVVIGQSNALSPLSLLLTRLRAVN